MPAATRNSRVIPMAVDDDPVGRFDTGVVRQVIIGRHANSDDHDVDGNDGTVGELRRRDASVMADQTVEPRAFPYMHAVRAVNFAHDRRGGGRGDALKDAVGHFDDGHLEP